MKTHLTHNILLNAVAPVTVNVIGVGGNGAQMISHLARINRCLLELGHSGLHVCAFDNDEIEEINIGRQLYSQAEVGENKAISYIEKINRHYGLAWDAMPFNFESNMGVEAPANITISCVDTVKARQSVFNSFIVLQDEAKTHHHQKPLYWMDLGNGKDQGQVILATVYDQHHKQPLINVLEMFPDMLDTEDLKTPSCSMAQSLQQQSLFINSILCGYAGNLLMDLFTKVRMDYHGYFVNLESGKSSKVAIR